MDFDYHNGWSIVGFCGLEDDSCSTVSQLVVCTYHVAHHSIKLSVEGRLGSDVH